MKAPVLFTLVLLVGVSAGCNIYRSDESPLAPQDQPGIFSALFHSNSCEFCENFFYVAVDPGDMLVGEPAILDAWTTNLPFENPWKEVYTFKQWEDTLAFVTFYSHAGGRFPKQLYKGYLCGEDILRKACMFNWTIELPPGTYLLINWYGPWTKFPVGNYDWATRVGDVIFGSPKPYETRPLCFEVVQDQAPSDS